MRPTQLEFANPREWLTRLADGSDGYRLLVSESQGFGRAAYRLARARCKADDLGEPCLDDLQAAAALLADRLGNGATLPIKSLLPSPRSQPPAVSEPSLQPALTRTPAPLSPSQRRAASKSRPHGTRVSVS